MTNKEFRETIKSKGLTQRHIASKIEVNETLFSQYLSDNSKKVMPEKVKEKLTWFLMNN